MKIVLNATLLGIFLLTGTWCVGETKTPWSIRPLKAADPPETGWGKNAVDAFISAGEEFKPTPPADRRTLVRRVSYDLTGLPPSLEQVERFVADPRSDDEAFKALINRLLASPQYGEHWGRHWLDVVRYADTAGENSDHPLPHAWRYRNWVIDAFNRDQPYDQFVRDQLAGDLIHRDKTGAERTAGIVATGYLALSRRFGHDIDKSMHLTHEDAIDNIGKAFLGLSVSCARCHDHKHDPITTKDYYALYAVLDATRFSFPGCEPKQQPRDLVPLASGDGVARRKAWAEKLAELREKEQAVLSAGPANRIKEVAAKELSKGEVKEGESVHATPEPIRLDVKRGEAIQLSILPNGNYGADTTILEYTITHSDGRTWSVQDLIDTLISANPLPAAHGAHWCFLDTTEDRPKLLLGRLDGVSAQPALKAWENDKPPSVLVNTSRDPIKVWTTLPPRTFFCHPGPGGPVAIAWLNPVDGSISINLTIRDGHPGGPNGVGWRLEHFADPEIGAAYLALGEASQALPDLGKAIADHQAREPGFDLAYAVTEGEAKPARIQERGDPEVPGDEVPKRFLALLGGATLTGRSTSGRLELADAIASASNPLTARVMVNRIWAWHFGRGLVETPNDFGNHGVPPRRPELLDYLAQRFIDSGWSVKAMHRLILSSATWRQAGSPGGFLSRHLTAEELRDSLLAAAGTLDRSPARGHPFPAETTWKFTQHNPFAAEYATDKRSVYMMRKRNRVSRFFALFNGADPNAGTAMRDVTTVPTQALYFMNDPFFHDCAERFAQRIREAASGISKRLDFATRKLFARPATEAETVAFERHAEKMSPLLSGDEKARDKELWNGYARVLLGSNEFLYID